MAAFLTPEKYPEVQLTYCVPGEYNVTEYSEGSRGVLVEEIQH